MRKPIDRTGQVWVDKTVYENVFIVLGPPTLDKDDDLIHPVFVLVPSPETRGHRMTTWYEFGIYDVWEYDIDMERLV